MTKSNLCTINKLKKLISKLKNMWRVNGFIFKVSALFIFSKLLIQNMSAQIFWVTIVLICQKTGTTFAHNFM